VRERDLAQLNGRGREEQKSLRECTRQRKNYEQKHEIFQNRTKAKQGTITKIRKISQ
jgi:hypothetical protein